jgi:hypothetical protein
MLDFLDHAKRWLREFIELGFLSLLALVLVYLILGDNSGDFVKSVAENVGKFVALITAPGLIGIAIIIALVYLIAPRWRQAAAAAPDEKPVRPARSRRS